MGRVLLCDLYNTLVKESRYPQFLQVLEREVGLPLDTFLPAYRSFGKHSMTGRVDGMMGRLQRTLESIGISRTLHEMIEISQNVEDAYIDCVDPYPDTLSTIQSLSGIARVCIVSNASSYSHRVLRKVGISPYVTKVFLSCDIGLMKPDPAVYRKVLLDLDIRSGDCLFIGDGEDDELMGAKGVGINTVLIDRGLAHTRKAKVHADYVVSNMTEYFSVATEFVRERQRHEANR